jgi:hypothetical protein
MAWRVGRGDLPTTRWIFVAEQVQAERGPRLGI